MNGYNIKPNTISSAILNNRFKVPYWFYIYEIQEKSSFLLEIIFFLYFGI